MPVRKRKGSAKAETTENTRKVAASKPKGKKATPTSSSAAQEGVTIEACKS
jgi:hypothetical protein